MQQSVPKLVWTVGINILAVVGILFTLYQTRQIVAWMLIALLFSLAIDPAVEFLERKGFRRGWAIGTLLLCLGGIVALLLGTVLPPLIHQGHNLITSAPDLIERFRANSSIRWLDGQFHILTPLQEEWTGYAKAAAMPLLKIAQGLFSGVLGTITIVVLTVFMLTAGGELFNAALLWIAPAQRERYVELSVRIRRSVGKYVMGTLLVASIGGVVTGTTLAILGVPYFLPLGMVMILLGVVPFIGPMLGGTLVVGTTFLAVGAKEGFIALAVFVAYQQTENHILQPMVQRKTIEMNPLLIIIVMLIGTGLAGIFGALLSLPIAAAVQVILQGVLERRQDRLGAAASPPLEAE